MTSWDSKPQAWWRSPKKHPPPSPFTLSKTHNLSLLNLSSVKSPTTVWEDKWSGGWDLGIIIISGLGLSPHAYWLIKFSVEVSFCGSEFSAKKYCWIYKYNTVCTNIDKHTCGTLSPRSAFGRFCSHEGQGVGFIFGWCVFIRGCGRDSKKLNLEEHMRKCFIYLPPH